MIYLNNISIFELQVFDAVSAERSVRGAARRLGLEPSHVSKVVARLETKLGQQLVVRHPGGAMLSRDGLVFAERLKDFLAAAQDLLAPTSKPEKLATLPVVTLGSVTYVNQVLMTAAFPMLSDMLTKVRLRVIDLPPDTVMKVADRAGFDFVIHTRSDAWPKKWHVQALGTLRWALCARAGHRLGRTALLDEVLREPFIVPTYWQDEGYSAGDDMFPVPWTRRIRGHEASSANTALQFVMASDHLVFAPAILLQGLGIQGRIREIDVQGIEYPSRTLYLVTRSETVSSSIQKNLAKALKTVIAKS